MDPIAEALEHDPWSKVHQHNWQFCDHPMCQLVRQYEAKLQTAERERDRIWLAGRGLAVAALKVIAGEWDAEAMQTRVGDFYEAAALQREPQTEERPYVVTLCGSTRFKDDFEAERRRLTLDGYIVIGCGVFGHADGITLTDDEKAMLDRIHLRKIDLADRVHVINPGGYIGHSTANEIAYARNNGKRITYLEPQTEGSEETASEGETSTGRTDESLPPPQGGVSR